MNNLSTEEKLKIIRDAPGRYHFRTKDDQLVDIEYKAKHLFVSLFKWGTETSFLINLSAVSSTQHRFLEAENRIEIEKPDFLLRVYPIDTRSTADFYGDAQDDIQCHDGGLRFELVLKKKRPAASNSFIFPIVAKNLRFSYQPFLTEEEKEEGTVSKSFNVEDSYAVYHTTKKNNQYMTGKAFHIYRPIAEDALGAKAWCSIRFDKYIDPTSMTIIIPQQFLDEATYPITVDPDLGYTSVGGTNYIIASRSGSSPPSNNCTRRGSAWTATSNGTTVTMKAYTVGSHTSTIDCSAMVNQKDSEGANSHGEIDIDEIQITQVAGWKTWTLNGQPITNTVTYVLSVVGDGSGITWTKGVTKYFYVKGDENGAVASYVESSTGIMGDPCPIYTEDPWTQAPEGTTIDYSIYCNYTEAEEGWTGKIIGVTDPAKVCGVPVADIAKVMGVA